MVARRVRNTRNTARVLEVFLAAPAQPVYGYQLMERLGLHSGQVYPVLARLQAAGWIEDRIEDIDPVAAGRPPRRYYLLVPDTSLASTP